MEKVREGLSTKRVGKYLHNQLAASTTGSVSKRRGHKKSRPSVGSFNNQLIILLELRQLA